MVTRIFGRKKYGKTKACLEAIRACVESKTPCYLIVPEQDSLSAERRIADEIGSKACLYLEVVSFTRLCNLVFRKIGGIAGESPDSACRLLCMAKTLELYGDSLSVYKNSAGDITFAANALRMADEFSAYRISGEEVDRVIESLGGTDPLLCGKLQDMSLLSAGFKSVLMSVCGTTGDALDRLGKVLEEYPFFSGSHVFIDAFYGFTPQELYIMQGIMRSADEVTVTFCTDKSEKDGCFERPITAAGAVRRLADTLGITVQDICLPQTHAYSAISVFEERFSADGLSAGNSDFAAIPNDGSIRIISCSNPINEARAVAALIRSCVMSEQVRYRDIAVCARHIEQFDGIIDVCLEKVGIPFHFSAREDLLTKPVISYILSVIDFVSGWRQSSFLRIIKSGLCRVSLEQAAQLENYIRTWNITGKQEFLNEWFMNPEGYVAEYTEKAEDILKHVVEAKEAVMDPILHFRECVHVSEKMESIAAAVYHLITDSNYDDVFTERDDIRFRNLVVKALEQIVRVCGNDHANLRRFADLFRTAVGEYDLADIPQKLDSVLIGSSDLVRSGDVKYMFVLGCNHEYMPSRETEDSVFSDYECERLLQEGIRLSTADADRFYDEYFLAYQLFCAPSKGLFLLYSERDMKHQTLRRSILLDGVASLFTENIEEKYPFAESVANLTSVAALADDMYDCGDKTFYASCENVLKSCGYNYFDASDSFSDHTEYLSPETAEKLYCRDMRHSPSGFEDYAKCHLKYFVRHTLNIRPLVKAELDSVQNGLISHRILEWFVKELAERKVRGECFTHEEAKRRIRELMDMCFDAITHCNGKSDALSARFTYLYDRLYLVLSEIGVNLVDEIALTEFIPTDFEASIGKGEGSIHAAPINVIGSDGMIRGSFSIVGQVDRLDLYEKDGKQYIRIIDYKTGTQNFEPQNVDYGFNLQMLLYLYCLCHSEERPYGDNVIPAGVLYIPVAKPSVLIDLGEDGKDSSNKTWEIAFRGKGILPADKELLEAMEHGLNRRFIPVSLKKDGEFTSDSKVLPWKELTELLEKAAEVSGRLAGMIAEGDFCANPYRFSKKHSCSSCDYAPVCRIENKNPHIRYAFEEVIPARGTDDTTTTCD